MSLLLSKLNFTLIRTTLDNVAMWVSGYNTSIGLIRTAIALCVTPVKTSFLSPAHKFSRIIIHGKGFKGGVAAGDSFATFTPSRVKAANIVPVEEVDDIALTFI